MRPAVIAVLASIFSSLVNLRGDGASSPPPIPSAPAGLVETVSRAPSLQAARARAEAADARTGAAGRFPDPTVEGMYSQVRPPMGGDKFPMWEVTLTQPLPKAGERSADRARASAVMSMAQADYAVMAGEMVAETAMALVEADAAQARAALFESQISRAEKILSALDTRLASGSGRVADRLALQSQIASMRLMIAQENLLADDAFSDARGRLGLAPDVPLPAWAAPDASEIDPESLPALRLAAAKAEEARAMIRMARASTRPMTSVGLRFGREQESMGDLDTIGVIFMTELPFRSRSYALAEQRAARAEETAARADADSARHRARAALSRAVRAERLATTSRKLADETSARLDAEYDSLVRSAGTSGMAGDGTSILMVLEILERQTDTELQLVEADYAARSARSELWRYAPASLF